MLAAKSRIGLSLLAALACLGLGVLIPHPLGARELPRFALVIGNEDYRVGALSNPVNDSRAIASVLREVGFRTVLLEDADAEAMRTALADFKARAGPGSVGLFYFAGHAVQNRGLNYLLPVDFELAGVEELPEQTLAVDEVLRTMDAADVGLKILILDACRDNPFGDPADALGTGLAVVERAHGETLVAFATSAGAVAADGAGPNSPFTGALVSALEKPGEDIYGIFRRVRAGVRVATEGRQLPWVSGSLESEFIFRPEPGPDDEEETATASAAYRGEVTLDSVYWDSIRRSTNPADFALFVDEYPNSPFADLAAARRTELLSKGEPSTAQLRIRREDMYPDVVGGLGDLVTDCDIVASDPKDPGRLSSGVSWGLVNTPLAIRVCARDLAGDPDNPRLQFLVGRVLEIAQRLDEATTFYQKAVDGGYSAAMRNLGHMYRDGRGPERDYGRAVDLYRRAALLGNMSARNSLGGMYSQGWGVPQSHAEALLWVRLAADNGWPPALNALGNIYRKGQGVAADDREAFAFYMRAAQQGDTSAMNDVAKLYRDGRGVEKDIDRALEWFTRAIAGGNPYAPHQLGRMYAKGWGVERNPERAIALFRLAADRGFAEGLSEIGHLYEEGVGVEQDLEQAYYHQLIAVLGGYEKAAAHVERLAGALAESQRARLQREAEVWAKRNGPIFGDPSISQG